MQLLDCVQQSPEWFDAKCGVPSASNFSKIVTSKGEPSTQAKNYLYQLVGERLTGLKTETHQSQAMLRGIELEAEARSLYEMIYDVDVQQVGLVMHDSTRYCCSPDGLIGPKGLWESVGLEIKCPLIHTHVSYLLNKKLPTEYVQQVQGSMLVTGFNQWVFMSYHPGIKSLIITAERDEAFITKLEAELVTFCDELDRITEKLRAL